MKVKVTRDDHFVLFIGLGFSLVLGAWIGAMVLDLSDALTLADEWWVLFIAPIVWVFGWISFILTRP